MHSPYTPNPAEAFAIAQASTGAALTALLWGRPFRPRVANVLFLAAIWLTALLPSGLEMAHGLGVVAKPDELHSWLRVCALLATLALAAARPHWLAIVAFGGQLLLGKFANAVHESDNELQALHLAWLGLLFGLVTLATQPPAPMAPRPKSTRSLFTHDAALFAAGVAAAAIVGYVVLGFRCDSADEWAYTYQAAVFSKLHAYGEAPPCFSALQSYWVFTAGGRAFSQYTPGWPLFMAPFEAARVEWLAGPAGFGVFVVGAARLARRAARGAGGPSANAERAGIITAMSCIASSTLLINGGSRFCHVFVVACWAWMVEATCAVGDGPKPRREEVGWGVVLGLSAAWILATRPGDAALLGLPCALYFLSLLLPRRVPGRSILSAALAFAVLGGFTLVVLRLQLGTWFATGYSLTSDFHSWSSFKFSVPKPDDLRWSIQLDTGSYCWWPLAPALGLAGLTVALRGSGRAVPFLLVAGLLPLLTFYSYLELGRGSDFGYGPRYLLVAVLPMAVGSGVAFGPLWNDARHRVPGSAALGTAGPWALAVATFVSGVIRLAPLVYPYTYEDVHSRNLVFEAAEKLELSNAIVWIEPGTTPSDPLDLTQNYPLNLYRRPRVLYAIDQGPEMRKCVSDHFPGRQQYKTAGRNPILLLPD
ncbi:MAG TPA: hypothetical protein VGI39_23250 [Polyangiaceae bacterium]